MKRIVFAALAVLLVFAAGCTTQDTGQTGGITVKDPTVSEMKQCVSDDDCMKVFDCCCGTAINVLLETQWNAQLDCGETFCTTIECTPAYAACENGKCIMKEYDRTNDYLRCERDEDCICGADNQTGGCAIGSYAFITRSETCLGFCTEETTEFSYDCVNKICAPVEKS